MKFFVSTFGCRANQADSAVIREDLVRHNLEEVRSHHEADVVIVNSCTVTHSSDKQVKQLIRKIHRENPTAKIVVTGCYAQRKPEDLIPLAGVSHVVGNHDKSDIGNLIEDALQNDGTFCGPVKVHTELSPKKELQIAPFMDFGAKTRPFLKIQDGCDAKCSYCIIPSVRGPGCSAPPDEIVSQVNRLIEAGYQEVVLTGIHLGTYGSRLQPPTTLAALIETILQGTPVARLRIGSVEPMRFSSALVTAAVASTRIAPHFHLPLQSGSDKILRLMRRPYTVEHYSNIVSEIRARLPHASIGADVIAGFPNETEADFIRTYEFIQSSPLTYLHVFSYSAREGTHAATLPDQVDPAIIKKRSAALHRLSAEMNDAFRRTFLGKSLSVLTLNEFETDEDGCVYLSALSDNYLRVKLPRDTAEPNRLLNVRVNAVKKDYIMAEILTRSSISS